MNRVTKSIFFVRHSPSTITKDLSHCVTLPRTGDLGLKAPSSEPRRREIDIFEVGKINRRRTESKESSIYLNNTLDLFN